MSKLMQKKVVDILSEGKAKTMREVLKKAGYCEETTRAPNKVFKTKSFQELLNKYLPDDYVAKKQKILTSAATIKEIQFSIDEEDSAIKEIIKMIPGSKFIKITKYEKTKIVKYLCPLYDEQRQSLDMVHKLKNNYKLPEQHITINKFDDWTPEELLTYAETGTYPERLSGEN